MESNNTEFNNPTEILERYFGHTEFRPGQIGIIENILSGRDCLGIMPTGAGKSVCYQVPALALGGVTLVISPLISLMKDQVAGLVESGVKAAYINSTLTQAQFSKAMERARAGLYKIIYVAPERLLTNAFLSFAINAGISLVAVDESHCVSQWGQDFRPSYLFISEFIEKLPRRPVIGAFTATATNEVREDIIRLLKLSAPFVTVTGFDRKNLYYSTLKPRDKYAALISILGRNRERSGIVYCLTRKAVDEVCNKLNKDGYQATPYHAGLTDAERHKNQDDFIYDRKLIMVATNAFGMGIDKSNVSFIVHYNMPKNLESYYQEAGRAGRDGGNAECVLLYGSRDVRTNQFLITHSENNAELTEEERLGIQKRDLERLKQVTIYSTTTDCLRQYILRYFGEKAPGFCGNCGNCDINFETADITVEAQKIISCVYRIEKSGRRYGKTIITDILRGSKSEKIKRLKLDELTTYGIMADVSAHRIHAITEFLIENDYLEQLDDKYPVIGLADRWTEIIRNRKTVLMKLPKESHESKPARAYEVNGELFAALKSLRSRIAGEEHLPAYIIFADSALYDMCRKLPGTKGEFLDVSGVGRAKMEKYGDRFIDIINTFSAAQEGHDNI